MAVLRISLLGVLAMCFASLTLANAPNVSERPVARPGSTPPPSLERLIESTKFDGDLGVALIDLSTGAVIETRNQNMPFAPASVTKAITGIYALETLGAEFTFDTQVATAGDLIGSTVQGDLILIGSGDPTLDTDDLAQLAQSVKAKGITRVTGRLLYHASAMPQLRVIDASQPSFVGYNPAISGLNLNFNRVYFEWKRVGSSYQTTVDARSEFHRPKVSIARVGVTDRSGPLFTYDNRNGVDHWNVRRNALGNGGGRWLPVRDPARYTAEVFRSLLRTSGVEIGALADVTQLPSHVPLASHKSAPLSEIVEDMLKYSTNLTAELIGLRASQTSGPVASLSASATRMQDWTRTKLGMKTALFVDHSGLGDKTRITPADMVRALTAKFGRDPSYVERLKPIAVRDWQGNIDKAAHHRIQAKTGTLNFVSSLAGYLNGEDGRNFAFVIFSQNMDQRRATQNPNIEMPKGARTYNTRARRLQRSVLTRWAELTGLR